MKQVSKPTALELYSVSGWSEEQPPLYPNKPQEEFKTKSKPTEPTFTAEFLLTQMPGSIMVNGQAKHLTIVRRAEYWVVAYGGTTVTRKYLHQSKNLAEALAKTAIDYCRKEFTYEERID